MKIFRRTLLKAGLAAVSTGPLFRLAGAPAGQAHSELDRQLASAHPLGKAAGEMT
jgi:hypothetical protein